MPIVLFAIIGAAIDAGVAYWICYGAYCVGFVINIIANVIDS